MKDTGIPDLMNPLLDTLVDWTKSKQGPESTLPTSPEALRALIFDKIERARKEGIEGDYALPCFFLAKELRTNPKQLASELATYLKDYLDILDYVGSVSGFVNLSFGFAAQQQATELSPGPSPLVQDFLGPDKIQVEFSQPNTHKDLHIGHVRNTLLGDTLIRLLRRFHPAVEAANYFGDEGVHIAKVIWWIKKNELYQRFAEIEEKAAWLGELYAEVVAFLDKLEGEDLAPCSEHRTAGVGGEALNLETAKAEISEVLRRIEKHEKRDYKLYKETRQWSLDHFAASYAYLGVEFDRIYFESDLTEEAQKIVDEYLAKKVFVESEGAVGADLGDKLGFFLLRKSDGNSLYGTKDLALARLKFERDQVGRAIYVVGSEQKHHFAQVFATLEKMGFAEASRCHHLSYAHVTLPSGKMSSRKGQVIPFSELKSLIEKEVEARLEPRKDMFADDAERQEITNQLALAAIRFAMLATDPGKEIVFDPAVWTSFEGASGPYLCYAYTRARSILRQLGVEDWLDGEGAPPAEMDDQAEVQPMEAELLWQLEGYRHAVAESAETLKPSILAHYLYNTAQVFNRFYAQVPIKKSTGALQTRRLQLVWQFCKILEQGSELLGLHLPKKM